MFIVSGTCNVASLRDDTTTIKPYQIISPLYTYEQKSEGKASSTLVYLFFFTNFADKEIKIIKETMKNLLQALSLSAAILLASCSQDKGGEVLSTASIAKPVNVNLSIEADLEDDALRSSLRSLSATFSKENNWRPEIAELVPGQTVPLNLVFTDGTTMSHHQSIPFTVTQEGKLQYKGDIAVPGYNTTSKWYVTAIYGGAFSGDANNPDAFYGYAPQMYQLGENQTLAVGTSYGGLNIPFMSGWTPVEGSNNPNTQAPEGYFKVKLRPFGYLLRINIENRRDHKLFLARFDPSEDSEAEFFTNVNFKLSKNLQDLQQGAYPITVKRDGNVGEGNARLINAGVGVDIERGDKTATKAGTFLMWVMPKDKITSPTTYTLNAVHYKNGAEWNFPFKLTLTPEAEVGRGGVSSLKTLIIPNDHKIYRKLYDIDYVALGNMADDGTQLAEGVVGYSNTYNEYNKNYRTNATIKRYGTDMTPNNWSSILPQASNTTYLSNIYDAAGNSDGWSYFDGRSGEPNNPRDKAIRDGSYMKTVIGSDYVTYAIRTLPSSTMPGKKGAFRYAVDTNGNLTVEMVHLDGNYNNSPSIASVSTESYWSTARQYGEVVKRVFPVTDGEILNKYNGRSTTYGYVAVRQDGSNGASILWNRGAGRVGINLDVTGTTSFNYKLKRQVRLMLDEPQPVRVNP